MDPSATFEDVLQQLKEAPYSSLLGLLPAQANKLNAESLWMIIDEALFQLSWCRELDELLTPLKRHRLQEYQKSSRETRPTFDLFGENEELQAAEVPVEQSRTHIESRLDATVSASADLVNGSGSSRNRLPCSARERLAEWLVINADNTYLDAKDAEALAHLTTLTPKQVKTHTPMPELGEWLRTAGNLARDQTVSPM